MNIRFTGIFLILSCYILAETDHPRLALQFFKEGKFKEARNHSWTAISDSLPETVDKNVLSVYVLTENNISKLHEVLSKIYAKRDSLPENFYDQVYAILERSLVANDMQTGLYWGTRFKKEARAEKNYARGLYLYSCILAESGRLKEGLYVAKEAMGLHPEKKLEEKLRLFRISNIDKAQIPPKEAEDFLNLFPGSEFSDRVLHKLIRHYEDNGESKKLEYWKEEFKKNFTDSPLYKKIFES